MDKDRGSELGSVTTWNLPQLRMFAKDLGLTGMPMQIQSEASTPIPSPHPT